MRQWLKQAAAWWRQDAKLRTVILVTLLLLLGMSQHLDGFNGPSYWRWRWRGLPTWMVVSELALAALPWVLAVWGCHRRGWSHRTGLALLATSVLATELLAVSFISQAGPNHRFSLHRLTENVLSSEMTSYATDAAKLTDVRTWLHDFPARLAGQADHSRNKPPGPILFHWTCQHLAGSVAGGAWLAAWLLAGLAMLAVPATYLLGRTLTGDGQIAWLAAAGMAWCPGLLFFLPMLDQAYPLLAVAMIYTWHRAITQRAAGWALAFGAVFAAQSFITYNVLVLGLFLAGYTGWQAWEQPRAAWPRLGGLIALALGCTAALYGILYLATGFSPLLALQEAIHQQHVFDANLKVGYVRPYPGCMPWDVYDFLLGSAWLSGLLVAWGVLRAWRQGPRPHLALLLLIVGQVLGLTLTGLLRTETARVWLFLQPLWMVAMAVEVRHWRGASLVVLALCWWCLLVAVCQHLWFMH